MNIKPKGRIQFSAPKPLNQDASQQNKPLDQSQHQQTRLQSLPIQATNSFQNQPQGGFSNQSNFQLPNGLQQTVFNYQTAGNFGAFVQPQNPVIVQQPGIRIQAVDNNNFANNNPQNLNNQPQTYYQNSQNAYINQFSNSVLSQSQPSQNLVPFQNIPNNQNIENTRIYNFELAQLVIPKFKNTTLEEFELNLSRKDKSESQTYFKSNIQSLNSCLYGSQPNIFDLPQVIERTKIFCQKNQNLAMKLKYSMENFLMYDNNKMNHEQCFEKFCMSNKVNPNIQNNNNLQQEMNVYQQQKIQVIVPFDVNIFQQEIQYLVQLNNIYQLFVNNNRGQLKNSVQIEVKSLPIYTIFLYNFLIKQREFNITVEYQDYYFFESITQQQNQENNNGKFLALLLNAFKCEQRLFSLVYSDQNCSEQYIDFESISQFFSSNSFKNVITLQIQLGNPPDYTKRPYDKYDELLLHYEKGCKSQIFNFILDGKWPETSFQKSYDEQLWLIWMRQMQEKIIDFQLFIRAKVKQGNIDSVNKEFSLYFSQKLKQFYLDIENQIYSNLSQSLYCISHNVVSQEKAKINSQVKQIIYSMQDQSKIMTGHIILKRGPDNICFYFKDLKDQQIKKVMVIIDSPQQLAQKRQQFVCQSDFQMKFATQIDRIYQIQVNDSKNLHPQYNVFGKFYDTLLVNQLIQLTRKNELDQEVELSSLLSQNVKINQIQV